VLPFRLTTNSKPQELSADGTAVLSTLQRSDGRDAILSTAPAALLTSGTISLGHTPAPTIKTNAVVTYKSITSSLVNETCEL